MLLLSYFAICYGGRDTNVLDFRANLESISFDPFHLVGILEKGGRVVYSKGLGHQHAREDDAHYADENANILKLYKVYKNEVVLLA